MITSAQRTGTSALALFPVLTDAEPVSPLTLPPPSGELFTHVWLTFTPDTDPVEARRLFFNRFEAHPRYIFPADGLLWLGPL